MSLKISIPTESQLSPKIAVFGVGGGGVNAVNNMISANLEGVDFFVANTDAQALDNSLATNKIKFGVNSTKGLGAGSDPKVGAIAAEESSSEITEALDKYNLVFITAGMGGGTGTGGAPIVAKLAKERNILTVGVVTKPFHFEGARRMKVAEEGLDELQKSVDTLIIIPNQNLFRLANEKTTFADAFKMADEVLHAGVKGITDLITKPGLINLDFADIHAVMNEKGKAMMGTGEAEGENRAVKASEAAISNPLLDHSSMKGARGVLINITGGMDMTLFEVDEAANRIKEEVDPNANIIFGSAFDVDLEGKLRVSVVATGIDAKTVKIIDNNLVNKLGDISITNKEPSKEIKVEVTNKEQFIDNQEESIIENKKDSPMQVKHLNTSNNDDKLSSDDSVDEKDENYIPKQNSFYFNLNKNNHEYKKHDEKELNNNSSDKEEVVNKKDFNKIKSSSSIFEIPTFLRNKKD
ncbi:cell division protein FtsZ [Rickettsiales endosymbiont of Trichoplax sp. H2]|uniref:cell division protein FtsZ n=1 Tax=Rickettsiales endosymbiont of Trichoplax sp. H2 TaxID=2021221 RepID=UPI0012B19168|nr:cell division protein FtsZ [Rickettsiales endosymbiont of Trichoplax sp. H2]MSO13578.1 Cell division protein FtsZ [Rickettsiales endosymbiont of Trichoplax sp. H2]